MSISMFSLMTYRGLPPSRQLDFRISLVPNAAFVAKISLPTSDNVITRNSRTQELKMRDLLDLVSHREEHLFYSSKEVWILSCEHRLS